jgi:hypothetical protein
MWAEKTDTGYKFREKYRDPYTNKIKIVSKSFDRDTPQMRRVAQKDLDNKIAELQNKPRDVQELTFYDVYFEWLDRYRHTVKPRTFSRQQAITKQIQKVLPPDILIAKIDKKLIEKLIDQMYTFGSYSYDYTKKNNWRSKASLRICC